MEKFELVSTFVPTGDQPQAIDALVKGSKKIKNFRYYLVQREQERRLLLEMSLKKCKNQL